MAYAFTSAADDAVANYYNSAGLGFSKTPSIMASYLGYLTALRSDAHYVYFAAAYPMVNSAWGFDFIFLTLGEAEKRDSLGHYLGTELVWRIAPKISYARRVIDGLSLGIGWKYVYERYIEVPYWWGTWIDTDTKSWAFDFDLQYKPLHYLSIGAVVHNVGPNISYEGSGATDPLPRLTRVALAYSPVDNEYIKCTLSGEITRILVGMFADEDNTFWQNLKYEFDTARKGIGLEMIFFGTISLRSGYVYDSEDYRYGFTFGAGIEYRNFRADIGIDEIVYDFPTQNRVVSLSYRF